MPLAPGTTLGPYEIRGILGKGGMGEVYRARDHRLDRDVALKVISDLIAHDTTARTRFEREAKAIAALSHPNIVAIFDFSKDHDLWFTVTELLEGETLREQLDRGRLNSAEAIEMATHLAAGLAAAHERQIVHRDLKPENVFLTRDGVVKILDFGLAVSKKAAVEQDKTEVLTTREGQIVGTVAYMSPEQLRGEPVTPASDIFSLGCVLYECVAGRRPFRGDSTVSTIAAILTDVPDSIDAEPALASIILRCLEKDASARFASAQELRAALVNPAPKQRPSQATRVMVLPFRMLRPDGDLDFLSYSLPDAIVGSLAGLASLIVRSSLASSQYGGGTPDLARIAAEQDVNAIVTGTILASGGRLRVSAQLTEMPAASVKWSHSTETSLDDIFGVQDELTRKIVRSLSGSINESDSRVLRKDVPRSAAAYEFFLRANQQAHAPQGWMIARDLYRRALEEDPDFAPAWTRLSRVYWVISKYTQEPGDNWALAEKALDRALELNPDLSLAQRYHAEMAIERGDTIQPLRELLVRVKKRPNDLDLHVALGKALRYSGLLQESLTVFLKVNELDSRMPTGIVHCYFHLGDYEKAHEVNEDSLYMEPLTLMMLGRNEEAERFLRSISVQILDGQYLAYHDSLLAILKDDRAGALRALDNIAEHQRDPEAFFYGARSYARIGEHGRALESLERASDGFFAVFAFEHDPWLESLRGSARFAEILHGARERHDRARRVFEELR